jgi:hypothetical protein
LANASARSCVAFQAIRAQKLASVKTSSTTMIVKGDFTSFGTRNVLFAKQGRPLC